METLSDKLKIIHVCSLADSKVADVVWKMPEKCLCPKITYSLVTKLSEISLLNGFFLVKHGINPMIF